MNLHTNILLALVGEANKNKSTNIPDQQIHIRTKPTIPQPKQQLSWVFFFIQFCYVAEVTIIHKTIDLARFGYMLPWKIF
jgi:hypothetical protein